MPTYLCCAHEREITAAQKSTIAAGIAAAKNHILMGIRDLLMAVLNVPESVVWVYLAR